MATKNSNAPIIIKRITAAPEGGHHGGAWKVAYADFVTAMMAFFLLMWLLNATTEKQRQGLADYFSPTVVRTASGTGGEGETRGDAKGASLPAEDRSDPVEVLKRHIQDELEGLGGESMQMKNLLRHVVTRVTDEGLVIELGDLADAPLFEAETAQPTLILRELSRVIARVLSRTTNQIAIAGHVRSYPAVLAQSPVWNLSNKRADELRVLLEQARFPDQRVQRVTGHADRMATPANPAAVSNNRLEVILLN
ncbi:flagellar motor protein MotB [Paracoccus sediminicola]|uniref:flagellar motor protein MotB n=1 Tax=Paracoccus sediminicola TaxID=3017783 RepID=UPI0022F07433|nr:flagellar motor protein MotB [Paracoccus sediminicola]WBU56332.1 chemotaxis protein MotB [Paracoccus sediminicola]